jgi:hypothetical protein
MRIAAKYVMPTLGLAHKLDVGPKRLVNGVTEPTLPSGAFYASAANKLNGPMVDQADFVPGLPAVDGCPASTGCSADCSPMDSSSHGRELATSSTLQYPTASPHP